ncbi:LytR/AlgR family response regulator transcription factor [Sediminitomix flava]|uniref:LytTR family two component transcriptional regulator n=1 Tax=Sediminitomix flava TaxID=379075 RepID=A0A315ZGI4_SEDFL|nr:LytTR family DNA-binding domain-containing protein [Sediminitomix flava]PWJ44621.1 LytTR family two component transcriptional regulator [Sediminitomix flava]
MNVLIANHRSEQVDQLKLLLERYNPEINIVKVVASTSEALNILNRLKQQIDLAFINTQLSDGSFFTSDAELEVQHPLIFTSNSEKDAFRAIKANAFDYLLYPLNTNQIMNSLKRLSRFNPKWNKTEKPRYKKRLMVKFGDKLQFKQVDDISYAYADGKVVYIVTKSSQRKYIVDHTLEELEHLFLNPDYFFRINRKYIVQIDAIHEVRQYVNSRLKLILNPASDKDMIVSREKVPYFKDWLNL